MSTSETPLERYHRRVREIVLGTSEASGDTFDWDDLYLECEADGEGDARAMVRYAYERGYRDALARGNK